PKYRIKRKIIYLISDHGDLMDGQNEIFENYAFCPIIPIDKGNRPYRIYKLIRKWSSFLFIFRLYAVLKKDNSQIIHSEDSMKLFTQMFISLMLGKKFIWQLHTSVKVLRSTFINKLFYYLIRNQKITMIADSKAAVGANFSNSMSIKNKIFFNPPGIELDNYIYHSGEKFKIRSEYGIDIDGILIGSTGRLHWAKGYEVLFESLRSIIYDKRIQLTLVIAGEGPLRSKLQQLSEKLGLTKNIIFLGTVLQIDRFLEMLDFYIQPSLSEGFPVAVLEAMAAKKPILCSDAGGMPELIKNGHTGIIVKSNDEQSLTKGIIKIINTKNSTHCFCCHFIYVCSINGTKFYPYFI
ncbi:uncharacterized protein METZ01_LOCUS306104, partial [marine metagenome]